MMFSKKIFSDNMKQLRQGKTQAEAAKAVGLSQQGWARYESGKVLPGAEAIHQICSTFGITSDWLLGLSPERAPSTALTDAEKDLKIIRLSERVAALEFALQTIGGLASVPNASSIAGANRTA